MKSEGGVCHQVGAGRTHVPRTFSITEHKHYVNAGGVNFALYVQREGNLNGKPATSTSYFHHDHLGSIAAVSNTAGVVVERMAYDPWG